MLQLFTPASKVQKDRQIMRETDARMAKYSRRGLILNLVAFGLCLALGDFYQRLPNYALGLAVGLTLITLWRGYFLFRFDSLYPRAPGRWRNHYFWASFVGAGWWSLIVASVTYVLGMQHDTLIIWLYSVVFYSSVASVLSPYRKFLGLYLFLGQIPAAATAILLGTWEGYIYGLMMLVFYLLLDHQGEVNSRIYWDRLEAQYSLDLHARNLEIEKRDSQAAAELKNTFLTRFGTEIRTSLNDILGALSLLSDSRLSEQQKEYVALASKAGERQLNLVEAVIDFSTVTDQNRVAEHSIFNLWKLIERLVEDVAHDAYQQGVELNHVLGTETPIRVKGDKHRLEQLLINVLSHAVKHAAFDSILFRSSFVIKNDHQGELQLTVIDEPANDANNPDVESVTHQKSDENEPLVISVCKGLAELMQGTLQQFEEPGRGVQYFINIPLELTSKSPKALVVNPELRQKHMLLVGIPTALKESFQIEMESWGMKISQVSDSEHALQLLDEQNAVDGLLIYTGVNDLSNALLVKQIRENENWHELPIIIACTLTQRIDPLISRLINSSKTGILTKPVVRKNLHQAVCLSLLGKDSSSGQSDKTTLNAGARKILLVDDHRVNQLVSKSMLVKLGYQVTIANNGKEALAALAEQSFDLVLMDCQMPEMDGYQATQAIRMREQEEGVERPLPIVAMTAHADQSDQNKCFAAGMSDYLAKPVSFAQLDQTLRRWLGQSSEGQATKPD